MNILYVDDNPRDRTLVERYIRTTPHKLVAVEKLEDVDLNKTDFDLILLDVYLGGKATGMDYLVQIRKLGIQSPVVAITALALPTHVAYYHQVGVDRVLEKPYEITALAQTIAHYEKHRS